MQHTQNQSRQNPRYLLSQTEMVLRTIVSPLTTRAPTIDSIGSRRNQTTRNLLVPPQFFDILLSLTLT